MDRPRTPEVLSQLYRPLCVVRAPIATRSGYGGMSRDIVRHLIEYDKYNVEIHSINWGQTPMNALDVNNPADKMILERIVPEEFPVQPDLYISISIPTEFNPVGKYNIGITAGIETTQASVEWVEAMNRMDVNFVISEHAKAVFDASKYQAHNEQGEQIGVMECLKPIEVLHNCVDTYTYKKINRTQLESSVRDMIDTIPEKFNYMFVGHWLRGDVGQDRKNVGLLIKLFYELFKRTEFENSEYGGRPGLILKTGEVDSSIIDREKILSKINQIKESVELEEGEMLPIVYLVHGDLTDNELNSLYNHDKVKVHITFTKGEGFGRPLLEASLTGKPIIAPGWSGHMDFLNPEQSILLGGELEDIHPSAFYDNIIIEGAKWMSVDPTMAATGQVEAFRNYKPWRAKANRLAKVNKNNFNYKKIRANMWKLLDKYVPEFEEPPEQKMELELNLPSLTKVKEQDPINVPEIKLPKLLKVEK